MKKIIILVTISILSYNISAQIIQEEGCSTDESINFRLKKQPWVSHNEYLYQILDTIGYYSGTFDYDNCLYRVPIKLWVYRGDDRIGGATDAEIKKIIQDANHYNLQNNTGFLYYLVPEISYINKSKHKRAGLYLEAPLLQLKNKSKGYVNVHLVDMIIKKRYPWSSPKSSRGFYNYLTNAIMIKRRSSETTLAHEIGHYFGLYHPHRNYTKGKRRQESVSRRKKRVGIFKHGLNCEINGDAICDTPAEPSLINCVNENCQYNGTKKDRWGIPYQPNTDNIMSYPTHYHCRKKFTDGQIAVMHYTARKKTKKEWIAQNGKNMRYRFDSYEPDGNREMASMLFFDTPQYHTFHKSYGGKKKSDYQDDTDWMKFEVTKKIRGKYEIKTTKGKYQSPNISIQLFDQNKNPIGQKYKTTTGMGGVKVDNLQVGTYYIQIKNLKTVSGDDIADYYIELTKLP